MSAVSYVPSSSSARMGLQFPKIDSAKPAESFFELIRAGKYQDSYTEYGAKTVAREYTSVVNALKEPCTEPTFVGEIVAEQMIEKLLADTENVVRFMMIRHFVLTMRDHGFETQFARLAEIMCYLTFENSDVDAMIERLLQEPNAMVFAESLAEKYADKPGAANFNHLIANMKRVASDFGVGGASPRNLIRTGLVPLS